MADKKYLEEAEDDLRWLIEEHGRRPINYAFWVNRWSGGRLNMDERAAVGKKVFGDVGFKALIDGFRAAYEDAKKKGFPPGLRLKDFEIPTGGERDSGDVS